MRRRKKALQSLLRLERHTLDQIRKEVAEQQARYDETDAIINTTKDSMDQERRTVAEDPEYFQSLGLYLAAAQSKVDLYSHQLNIMEEDLDAARDRLRNAFQDAKRFEIALDTHVQAEKDEEKALEKKQMDEIAGRSVKQE